MEHQADGPASTAPAGSARGEEEVRRALDLAYRALAGRERTESELRALLERRRAEPAAIEAAIRELTDAGYLDDARFAVRFAEDKRALARWGADRIARDLRRRGVAEERIEAALAEQAPEGERAAALALLVERFRGGLADDRDRDRAWRLLVRRGYEPELAYEVVRAHERRLAGAG